MQSVQHLCLRTVDFINRDNSFHLDSVARVKKLDSVTKQWLKINICDLCFLLLKYIPIFFSFFLLLVLLLLPALLWLPLAPPFPCPSKDVKGEIDLREIRQ